MTSHVCEECFQEHVPEPCCPGCPCGTGTEQSLVPVVVKDPVSEVEREEYVDPNAPLVGHWYWYKYPHKNKHDIEGHSLGCVTSLGSNYAEVVLVDGSPGQGHRVHLDEFAELCHPAPDAQDFINRMVEAERREVAQLMERVHKVTAALGVGQLQRLTDGGETQALARISDGTPVEDYKAALIKAKDETLPALFSQIKEANESMAVWMKAPLLPLRAQSAALQPVIKKIESRIFNVELYAGLTEKAKQIRDGAPAPDVEPIHLFQRRHYMDEEALLSYEHGGMDFNSLNDFDRWMAQPKNFERILPFPRCLVAFKVRREVKRYKFTDISSFINFVLSGLGDLNKLTFLYMRNGDQIFRLKTAIDFDEKLFPDLDKQQLEGKLYAKMYNGTDVERLFTEAQMQALREEHAKESAKYRQELKAYKAEQKRRAALPKEEAKKLPYEFPPRDPGDDRVFDRYAPYDDGSVYKDDIGRYIQDQMDKHNRLVLVLQGLLDRSPIFHPHPPWQIWTPEGFANALKLVFDQDKVLVAGEKPDFEAYRARCNAQIKKGSITLGQQGVWQQHEIDKDYERNAWRSRGRGPYHGSLPYGNDGPGKLAEVKKVSAKGCTFEWTRERQQASWNGRYGDPIPCRFRVETDKLFNISAYKPGDFKQFFDDPRTRAEYLEWAPMLLVAEEYHAGNIPNLSKGFVMECRHRSGKTKHGSRWTCDCGYEFSKEESDQLDEDFNKSMGRGMRYSNDDEDEED